LALLTSGCSLVLDFGGEVASVDAGPSQAACDLGEPNNVFELALDLPPDTEVEFALCPAGDADFLRFSLPAQTQLVALFRFAATAGNLSLTLFDAAHLRRATALATSTGAVFLCPSDSCSQLSAGDYVIEVTGVDLTAPLPYSAQLLYQPLR
jgi:hypothetical protein